MEARFTHAKPSAYAACRAKIDHMAGYRPPKKHLHKEFLYLNHDTVLNSQFADHAAALRRCAAATAQVLRGMRGLLHSCRARGGPCRSNVQMCAP